MEGHLRTVQQCAQPRTIAARQQAQPGRQVLSAHRLPRQRPMPPPASAHQSPLVKHLLLHTNTGMLAAPKAVLSL